MMRHCCFFLLMGMLFSFALTGASSATESAGEPTLPLGLEDKTEALEPELPFGLNLERKEPAQNFQPPAFAQHSILTGFWEARGGIRTQNDAHERDASLGETRLQLETQKHLRSLLLKVTSDFIYDPVFDHHSIRLEKGEGFIDLREAHILLSPLDFLDIKLGRQILTWGTGDMLFLNDLFPKDWKSFFIGRDIEYLKAPSDAVKVGFFTGIANLEVVYTPRFDPDRFIEGKRISYWNSSLGRRAGRDINVDVIKNDDWFKDNELALRLFRNVRGYELAAYGYYGFWKSPAGLDPVTSEAIFPDLVTFGASMRGKLFQGIGNLEFSYYLSQDDESGRNPFIKNSEFRNLIGYEQELARNFTVGVQYYLEYMLDYQTYVHNLPPGSKKADEDRHVITFRITKLLMNQNLTLSLFAYYSPSDQDTYLRPLIHYKINDHWSAETGGNIFWGNNDDTFFGQFEKNSNLYAGLRYGF